MGKKERFAFYLTPEKKAILERRYREDVSRSMTAFIERAVDFYLDYLSANDAGLFLPTSIKSYLDGRLGQLEDRGKFFRPTIRQITHTTMGTHKTILTEPMPSEPMEGMAAKASEMGPTVSNRGIAIPNSIRREVQLSWKDCPRGLI